ncbi:MAG: peptidoglycan-binding protein [Christensenella sp.]|nr:peptidoglycan-binding protein [Christensenella sp.]
MFAPANSGVTRGRDSVEYAGTNASNPTQIRSNYQVAAGKTNYLNPNHDSPNPNGSSGSGSAPKNPGQSSGSAGSGASAPNNSSRSYASGSSGAQSTRIQYQNGGSGGSGNPPRNGAPSGGGFDGGGPKSKKSSTKKNTVQQRFVAWLKRFLRSLYLMEKHMKVFLGAASGFVLVCIVVIVAVSGSRHKKAEELTAALALATPVPTVVATTATPEPTPSPTPEIRIEKGAEGEDVMALQKRLMELGYLAIDEPTSYFGNATKEAVKLFQRQHELQQDGICGTDTIGMIYAEEAKPYVMLEGAEGSDIESFQNQLVELGYLESNQVTGYYGTDTVEAVKKFQNRNDLTKDGKAGEMTIETINSPDARVSYTKEQEIIKEKKKQAALARASSAEGRIDKLISIAKKQLGDTYILGKSGPDSFDCSGLAYYCLRQVNVYTRRLNAAGFSKTSSWKKISSLNDVQRGDLLFFRSDDSSTIGHMGIYIGGGEMIDASSANGKVVRRGAKTSYWRRNFVVARRPIE